MKKLIFEKMDGWYDVYNKKSEPLAIIEWSKDWKCWVYQQEECVDMSYDCLQEVADFMKELSK